MSWHPTRNQSVSIYCIKYKKYTALSRIDGKCPYLEACKNCNYKTTRKNKVE